LGGYGFVFVGGDSAATPTGADSDTTVTMAFADQTYGRALNSVLLASGLQAKLDGRTLMVGTSVSGKTFGPQMSKVYRLNQASASFAADYLASLGAQINKVNVVSTTAGDSGGGASAGGGAATATFTDVETYGAATGPLRGLTGTTDSRLETVTLVGDSQLIAVAEGYLKQIDLRQRQVAVKVQVLNIDLLNDKSIDSSFSAKLGDTFIVSESGRAFMNFGAYRPGNRQGTGLLNNGTQYTSPGEYSAGLAQVQQQKVFDPPLVAKQKEVTNQSSNSGGTTTTATLVPVLVDGQEVFVPSTDPSAAASLTPRFDKKGRPIYVTGKDPNKFSYPENSFYSYVEAVIESSSAKTLAQPTLLVQEGQEAEVQTGTSVITSVSTTDTSNGSTQFEYSRENAGLSLKVKVSKIDDNGFVSLNINPKISVPEPAGESNGVAVFNIVGRSLSSGSIRLRDRQTLILTGVIQDQDKEIARKWPILGDLPLIGQLFRSTDSQRSKNELVILVTPMIVDDEIGGSYGYGYRPSTREARQLMGPS
jgi:type IV pilus assembly protein PilQ